MVSLSIDDVLKRAWKIRERELINCQIIWAEAAFSSMLKNLEEHIKTNIYAHNTIDTRLIDVMWILRGFVLKYGGEIDLKNSKFNTLGQNGHARRELEIEIKADESDLSKRLQNYLETLEYDNVDRNLSNLFLKEYPYAKARKEKPTVTQIARYFKVKYYKNHVFSEADIHQVSKKVGDKLLRNLEKVSRDIYSDLLSLWDYDSTWVRVEGNALNERIVSLGDRTLFNEENSRPRGSFAKFFDILKNAVERYQNMLSDTTYFIYNRSQKNETKVHFPDAVKIFNLSNPNDAKNDKGWIGTLFNHYHKLMLKNI